MARAHVHPTILREQRSSQTAAALARQVRDVAHPYQVRDGRGRLAEQAVGGGAHRRVRVGRAGHKRAGLLRPQAVDLQHAADAPAAHLMAFGLHPQPTRAVVRFPR
jgi:hypothetical protein